MWASTIALFEVATSQRLVARRGVGYRKQAVGGRCVGAKNARVECTRIPYDAFGVETTYGVNTQGVGLRHHRQRNATHDAAVCTMLSSYPPSRNGKPMPCHISSERQVERWFGLGTPTRAKYRSLSHATQVEALQSER